MKKTLIALFLALSVLAVPNQGISEIYKWVDENGVVTFKDTPPPTGVKASIFVTNDTLLGDSTQKGFNDKINQTTQNTVKSYPNVEIYSSKWCPTCKMAINYLNSKSIKYTKYDIDEDKAANERLESKYHQNSIPFTIIGNVKILGFSRQRFDSALGIINNNK
jgi:glutaredoxin